MSIYFWNARFTGIIKANGVGNFDGSTADRSDVFFPPNAAYAIRRKNNVVSA